MFQHGIHRWILATVLLGAVGCASTESHLAPVPLSQGDVDRFLERGQDARKYGITIYPNPNGTRFEFANRPRPDRTARVEFASPRSTRFPTVRGRTAITSTFPILLDTSSRQTWAPMSAIKGLEYRVFTPAEGEFADHVVAPVPGYAGVGNKLIFDKMHIESPIFYVLPAGGALGGIARAAERPDLDAEIATKRKKIAERLTLVMGNTTMRGFAYVRFDFPARTVDFSSATKSYGPPQPAAVVANLPMLDWRGRPAIQVPLDGTPTLFVLDTAGDFGIVMSGEIAEGIHGALALGTRTMDEVAISSASATGLPEDFPARLGLQVLGDYSVTLDFKNRRVWFEAPVRSPDDSSADDDDSPEPSAPIQYKGIRK